MWHCACLARCCRSLCLHGRPLLTHAHRRPSNTQARHRSGSISCGSHMRPLHMWKVPWAWYAQCFVCVLRASLVGMRFYFTLDLSQKAEKPWGLILNVIASILPSCCGFSFVLGHRGLFPILVAGVVALKVQGPIWDFSGGASGKEPGCQWRPGKRLGFEPWVGKIRWRRARQPTPVFLPGESLGQRSLVGYSPWGCKDTTEVT